MLTFFLKKNVWNIMFEFQRYLGEKAATVDFPTNDQAEICPKYLFEEPALIIHMCLDCRIASRQLEMTIVDKENQQLGKDYFFCFLFSKVSFYSSQPLFYLPCGCQGSTSCQVLPTRSSLLQTS